jgi:hypothetical protein
MCFDEQKIDLLQLRIIQGSLVTNDFEFSSALDMTGISAGQHTLRVEIYEIWNAEEKLTATSKETKSNTSQLKKRIG